MAEGQQQLATLDYIYFSTKGMLLIFLSESSCSMLLDSQNCLLYNSPFNDQVF